jgi:uncharacterized membrane protein
LALTPKLRNIRLTVGAILAVRLFVFQLFTHNAVVYLIPEKDPFRLQRDAHQRE